MLQFSTLLCVSSFSLSSLFWSREWKKEEQQYRQAGGWWCGAPHQPAARGNCFSWPPRWASPGQQSRAASNKGREEETTIALIRGFLYFTEGQSFIVAFISSYHAINVHLRRMRRQVSAPKDHNLKIHIKEVIWGDGGKDAGTNWNIQLFHLYEQ